MTILPDWAWKCIFSFPRFFIFKGFQFLQLCLYKNTLSRNVYTDIFILCIRLLLWTFEMPCGSGPLR